MTKHNRRDFAKSATSTLGVLGLGCGTDAATDGSPTSNPNGRPRNGSSGSGGASEIGDGSGGQRPVELGSGGVGGNGSGGDVGSAGAGGGLPLTCGELTRTNIEGPFFEAGSPRRSDIVGAEPGPKIRLRGRILDRDCVPIVGALIDFWEADEEGDYDTGQKFRGHQLSKSDGTYDLTMIIPGRYLNGTQFRPAHIHVKVTVDGSTLTTQLYFPDDPYNAVDPWYHHALAVTYAGSGRTEATFDFVIERD